MLEELKKSGIDLETILQSHGTDDLLNFLLLPKPPKKHPLIAYGIKSCFSWNAHADGKSDTYNFIHLILNNPDLFSKNRKNANMKSFFGKPHNKAEYINCETGDSESSKLLSAPFVCLFWLLLLSFLSKEASDQLVNILRKVTPHNLSQYSQQNTSGDEGKALNFVVLLLGSIYENFCQLRTHFEVEY